MTKNQENKKDNVNLEVFVKAMTLYTELGYKMNAHL